MALVQAKVYEAQMRDRTCPLNMRHDSKRKADYTMENQGHDRQTKRASFSALGKYSAQSQQFLYPVRCWLPKDNTALTRNLSLVQRQFEKFVKSCIKN